MNDKHDNASNEMADAEDMAADNESHLRRRQSHEEVGEVTSQNIDKQELTDAVERDEVAQALEEAAKEIRAAEDETRVYERVGDALTRLAKAKQRAAKEADRAEQNARTAVGNLRRPPSPERRPPSRGERFNRLMEEARADAANEARRSVAS